MCVCLCVFVSVSQNNGSINLKPELIVAFVDRSEEFVIGHCLVKVKVMMQFEIFVHLPNLPKTKLPNPIFQLKHSFV